MRIGDSEKRKEVLLHKRRVGAAQADGASFVFVCDECYEAFSPSRPWLCKYALANNMWLGRWDPLFRDANLSHQMLLVLHWAIGCHIIHMTSHIEGQYEVRPGSCVYRQS